VLHGRVREQARTAQLLDAARSGQGGALVVLGDPGTGKSALLTRVLDEAKLDMRVLRTQGIESEAPLAFAALQRLLRPLMPLAEVLPAQQAKALRVAFGMEAGEGAGDRFLVFLAALSLLAEASETQPLLVVVDDAHWLDDASAAALLFVARRLEVERVAMLFAARELDVRTFDVGELPTLRLAGLDLAATTGLLQERASSDVSPAVAAQLLASTGGNPLALVEMPQALSSDQLAGRASLPGQLPVTATIERVFLDRARRLSPGAQQLLLVAAADDLMQLATVESAAAARGAGPDALAEAERSGLVQVTGGKVELRHPLVRSALYAAATSIDRRHVHAALADALRHPDDADRRAWHRASSVDQPDADVVADLERAAGRAEARGGHEAAASAWERAAELSTDATGRAQRLFNASRSAWLAGRPVRARALVDSARAAAEDPLLLADVIRLRARVEWNTGSVKVAHRMLLEGARDVVRHDADRAREMAMVAAAIAAFGGDSGVDVDPATFATIPSDASERQRCYAELTLGLGEVVAGDWDAASTMLRRSFATGGRLDLDDLELLPNLGIAALHLGDTLASADYHQRLLTTARSSGAAVTVLYALTRLAFSDVPNGRWATAVAQQQEALRLGEGTGQPVLAAMPLATLVLLSALRGDDAYSQQLEGLERVLEEQPVGVLDMVLRDVTRWAKGLHAAPAWPTAFHHLAQISHPIIRRSAGIDRVEAAVHADQSETARLWIDDLEAFSAATGQPWAAAMAAHGRAVLAVSEDEDEAESWFERALALHADSVRPFERARTQLAYGEHLRRQRRRVDARVHLRAALETFEDLKALPWADRAAQELRASGESARKRDQATELELTPTELQVAQLVQQGLSNREVAAQLFVSPRTVDFHLRNVFAKTGISSRGALTQLSLT
jgi:DNA-binding CsgD family transcriptional regulator